MRAGALNRLVPLLAVLSCLSRLSGQETKVSAAELLDSLRGQAEKGDASAQYLLAGRYDRGQGVPQDYSEAARWYRKAAEQDTLRQGTCDDLREPLPTA